MSKFFDLFNGTMPQFLVWLERNLILDFWFNSILRGYGNVYFQNSPFCGVIVLAGIFVQSWKQGLLGILGKFG